MNTKIFCLVNLVSFASIHGMNLPLALDNLEKTLTQLTKFLAITDSKILQFEHDSQALQLTLESLNNQLEKLAKMPLEKAQFDPSEQPKNEIAQKVLSEIAEIPTVAKQLMQNLQTTNETLADIGDNFKKEPFNQNQKKIFISILTRKNIQAIENIPQNLQNILGKLQLLPDRPWGALFSLKWLHNGFNCVSGYYEITLPRIKELIEGNQKSIENDIESINELQSDTDHIYNQILSSLAKMASPKTEKTAIKAVINDFISIDTDPVFELACLINCIKCYIHFIKDTNLTNQLSENISAIASQNYSGNLQKEIKTNISLIALKMELIKNQFETLDMAAKDF